MSGPKYAKPRPVNEAFQRMIGSFKQFEKKIDKLQNDVTTHGQTLDELRNLITNISGSTFEQLGSKTTNKRTAGMQYDNYVFDPPNHKISRRKKSVRVLPPNLKAASVQVMHTDPAYIKNKILANSKGLPRHSTKTIRHSKAEASRKATTLRIQKPVESV